MDKAIIERTRRSLHVLAESILAGPQYRMSGTIRLYLMQNGFETKDEPRLQVRGDQLIHGADCFALKGAALDELAALVKVDPGPAGIYHDGANAELSEPIDVDAAAAQWMFDALNVGKEGLKAFVPAEEPVLWPEHFDVGILVDGVAYGVSPGDRHIGVPYAYVSATAPDNDPYWNESFGAARTVSELESSEAIREFFDEGRRRLSQ